MQTRTRSTTVASAVASSPPSSPSTSTSTTETTENSINSPTITLEYLSNQIKSLRSDITEEIAKQKEDIIEHLLKENQGLKSEIQLLKEELSSKSDELCEIERDVIDLQQYIRRNNIEICGIPDDINDKDLEKKVLEIADIIGIKVESDDVEACHRLKAKKKEKGPKKTIVRFVNRKFCDRFHRNKKKLHDRNNTSVQDKLREIGFRDKIYVNCNLCPYNKFLWGKCKKLYDERLIARFWVFNGSLYVAVDENDHGLKVDHLNTLKLEFPGYDFETKF